MYTNIEFVCSGNNGRSPVAERVGKRMLKLLGRDDVVITSSGTLVNFSGDLRKALAPVVEAAITRGILDKGSRERLEANPQAFLKGLTACEARMREAYLAESIGEQGYVHVQKQTIARPEAQLILPMDNANMVRVGELYESFSHPPRIETLGSFSGLDLRLEDYFPSTEQEYRQTAVQVEAAARVAVLRALNLI